MESFDQPIKIKLTGNETVDKDAIVQAMRERDLRLLKLADNYGIKLEKPEDFSALYHPLTTKLLESSCPGFEYNLTKVSGRTKSKTVEYFLGLALAYEGSNLLSKNKLSKNEFARNYAEHCIRLKKSRPLSIRDKQDVIKLKAQIQNDLSKVGNPSIVSFIRAILKAIVIDGLSAEEAAQTLDIKSNS